MATPLSKGPVRSVFRHPSLPESVHQVLRDRILNNDIAAGEPLLEVPLAEEFGVSRTTIRSAMRELQAERLIEIAPRRGARVIRMSQSDAEEVCFVRYTLEAVAVRVLTRNERRALADRMDGVLATMHGCAQKADFAGMVEADTDLHRLVVDASGHPLIGEMWSSLNGQMGALMRASLDRQRITLEESVERHADLIAALRELPKAAADAALREHYIRTDGVPMGHE